MQSALGGQNARDAAGHGTGIYDRRNHGRVASQWLLSCRPTAGGGLLSRRKACGLVVELIESAAHLSVGCQAGVPGSEAVASIRRLRESARLGSGRRWLRAVPGARVVLSRVAPS
jgi:hypothetical protein